MAHGVSKLELASIESFARTIARNFGAFGFWFIAAIAPVIVYHRVYMDSGPHAAHFWGDTTGAYWPDLAFFTRSIAQGELPLWNPNERGGFPFAFDPQPGVLYPLNWLFVLAGLALRHVPYELFQFKILVHLSITCVGWALWLSRRVSKPAALAGAFGATFGCYTLQHAHFGLIWPIAYVPWFLAALDRWVATRTHSAAFGMSACIGAIVTAGSPPAALYGLLVAAIFGTPQIVSAFVCAKRTERRAFLTTGILSAMAAAALAAPVILGAAQLTAASILEKRDFAYISSGSLTWSDLRAFLYPAASGAIVYLGIALVSLACVAIACRLLQPLTLVALAVALLGILLALGVNTPVLAWFAGAFPPARYFRLVFRYLYLTQVALGLLAAVGVDALIVNSRRAQAGKLVLLGLLLTSAAQWYFASRAEQSSAVGRDILSATRWMAAIVVVAALCHWRSVSRWISWAFGIVILFELCAFVPRSGVLRDGVFRLPRNLSPSRLELLEGDSAEHRIWDEFAIGFRAGSRLHVRDLRGYMDPLRLATYETMASELMLAPELLERWGVRWALPADHPYVGSGHKRVNYSRLRRAIKRENCVLELPNPRAPGFFTDFYEARSTDAAAWRALEANPLGARLQLSPEIGQVKGLPTRRDSASIAIPVRELAARLAERRNNALSFTLDDAPRAGWFVINEAYFPGWLAWVDGSPTPLYRVDGWIRGLPISQGSHRIELMFRPTGWLILASVASLLWVALGALAARACFLSYGRRHRRTAS